MNPIVIAFVAALLIPLFVASWRLSLLGLLGQGLLLGWLAYQRDPALAHASTWAALFDLVMVRGLGAPLLLYAALRGLGATARHDVRPPNLMSWTLAIALVLVAFRFADLLVPAASADHALLAGATAALLLGLLVLSTQTGPFSQMEGALRLENGIAFLELLAGHHELAMQLAQTLLLVATVLLFRWYLATLPRASAARVSAVEGGGP
jgi:hydrogenase-4 membrane subunit HyfE